MQRWGLLLVLLILAAVPRLVDLSGHSLNADEPVWMARGTHLWKALGEGDHIGATAKLKHPGLIPAALIGLSYQALGRNVTPDSLGLMDRVAAARLPIACLGALACPILFVLARRLWSTRVALFAALFLALDPIHIALSRVAHVDSTLSLFFMACLLTYAIGEEEQRTGWKLASGILLGCALLTKATAWVIPVIVFMWNLTVRSRRGSPWSLWVRPGDAWWLFTGLGVYAFFYTRLWMPPPDLWGANLTLSPPYQVVHALTEFLDTVPLAELSLVALLTARWFAHRRSGRTGLRAFLLGSGYRWGWCWVLVAGALWLRVFPHTVENGALVMDRLQHYGTAGEHRGLLLPAEPSAHPVGFYLFLCAIRFTECLLLLLIPGIVLAVRKFTASPVHATRSATLLIPFVVFVALMSFSEQMAVRYILPVATFLYVLSALGLDGVVYRIEQRWPDRGRLRVRTAGTVLASALVLTTHIPILLSYAPYYYLFFNRFIGGPKGAQDITVVGWGAGSKESIAALSEMVSQDRVKVGVLGEMHVMKYYWKHYYGPPGVTAEINARWSADSDYFILVLNRVQRYRPIIKDFLERNKPIRTVQLKGLDIAWIYGPDAVRPDQDKAAPKKEAGP